MRGAKAERALRWILRLMALAETLAFGAIFLPVPWYATIHRWLGLGEFPGADVTVYLARHLSAMYAVHAGFVWLASMDVRRYGGLIRYLGWSGLAFAPFVTWLDLAHGFAWYWVLGEGPALVLFSLAFLWLERGVRGE